MRALPALAATGGVVMLLTAVAIRRRGGSDAHALAHVVVAVACFAGAISLWRAKG